MIWLLVLIGGGVWLASKSGETGNGPKSLPDPEPASDWRPEAVESAACTAWMDGVQAPAEMAYVVARAAYPEHSWPSRPTTTRTLAGASKAKAALWNRLLDYVEEFDPAICEDG